jgi:nitroreductase
VNDVKRAQPDHPIGDLIANRWSPAVFDPRPVPESDLLSVFEAARWAPSCFNEQPWRYLVAVKERDPEEFSRMLACLTEGNRKWAQHAPVLALGAVSRRFARNDKVNRAAQHDLGLASATLSLEATRRGLSVHQMAGVRREEAAREYALPEDHEIVTAVAIGYRGDPDAADEAIAKRDRRPRTRRPLSAFVFTGAWGRSLAPETESR